MSIRQQKGEGGSTWAFFLEDIVERMRLAGVSKAELARRLDVSPARVTNLLKPDANPTCQSIDNVYDALREVS